MALTKVHNRMIEGAAVNVKDFGAVGDGTTDDTAAIQAAINTGKPVVFNGTYAITSPLDLSGLNEVVIIGDGWGNSVIKATSSMSYMIYNDGVTNSSDYLFEHFELDCNNQADAGFRLLQGKGHKFTQTLVRNTTESGRGYWFGESGASGATFYECQIIGAKFDGNRDRATASPRTDADYGFYFDDGCTDNKVIDAIVAYCQEDGIHVEPGSNIFIGGHVYGGPKKSFFYDNDVHVVGMFFDTPTEDAVYSDAADGTFIGCKFASNTTSPFHTGTANVYNSSGTFRVKIIGGVVKNFGRIIASGVSVADGSAFDLFENPVTTGLGKTTFFGDVSFKDESGARVIDIDTPAGTRGGMDLSSAGSKRWRFEKSSDNETGSDAGSKLKIYSYADDGSTDTLQAVINRNSGGKIEFKTDVEIESNVGFYGTAPQSKQAITGSRGSNAALANLLTALETLGLITDSTT